jgi:LmbE family N-acetylglucosaminyl deacetylase
VQSQPPQAEVDVRVLAIGAHPDDVELGCGGALVRHSARGDDIAVLVMTRGERGVFEQRSRFAEQRRAARILGAELHWGPFVDGEVTFGPEVVRTIDDAIDASGAEVVYTHAPDDSHQDHRATSQASLAAARRLSSVLFYETPSTQRFHPTVFLDVTDELESKLALVRSHTSQIDRDGPVDVEALVAQARFRGSQSRIRHAEAFEVGRFLWDLPRPGVSPADRLLDGIADRSAARTAPLSEGSGLPR